MNAPVGNAVRDSRREPRHLGPRLCSDEIVRRKRHLEELGFEADTIEALFDISGTLQPTETVDEKVAGLRERGFADPVKMITSSPAILGLAIDNIDAKLALARRASHWIDGKAFIEGWPIVLSYNLKRILFCARVTLSMVDGDKATFMSLLTKDQRLVVRAALSVEILTKKKIGEAMRAGNGADVDAVIEAHASAKIALSYRRYKAAGTRQHELAEPPSAFRPPTAAPPAQETAGPPFTVTQKLAAVERELRHRRQFYPRLVGKRAFSQAYADQQIALMEAIAANYRRQAEMELGQ